MSYSQIFKLRSKHFLNSQNGQLYHEFPLRWPERVFSLRGKNNITTNKKSASHHLIKWTENQMNSNTHRPWHSKLPKPPFFIAILWFYRILCDDTPDMIGSNWTWMNEPSERIKTMHLNMKFQWKSINERIQKQQLFHENYQKMTEKWPDVKNSTHFKKPPG